MIQLRINQILYGTTVNGIKDKNLLKYITFAHVKLLGWKQNWKVTIKIIQMPKHIALEFESGKVDLLYEMVLLV